ncbi:MAG: glycosyltransferase [Clostridium celatum]|nr:glycosyltransferase [Clostridium celatum]
MSDNLVSIIMSCYNEKIEWIKDSIESILNQTYRNIEFIIVCDNPKNTDLVKVLKNYEMIDSRIKLIINKKNLGLTNSLNTALLHATGRYIARMDADDICLLNRIELETEYLKKNKLDIVMSNAFFIDENENVFFNTKSNKINEKKIKKILKYYNPSIHPTWLFRKEILDKLYNYNDISYAEDYDFLCRAVLNDYKIGLIEEPLIKYRVRNNGITKSKRIYQEINSQRISKEYKKALKNHGIYNIQNELNNMSKDKISGILEEDKTFKECKEMFYKKEYIKFIFKIIKVLIKSEIKRNQIFNYIMYNIVKL